MYSEKRISRACHFILLGGGMMCPLPEKGSVSSEMLALRMHFCPWPLSLANIHTNHSAQLIPNVAKDPTVEIVNFARTPQWFVPRVRRRLLCMYLYLPQAIHQGNYDYPGYVKWAFAHIPGVLRAYRNWVATSVSARKSPSCYLLTNFQTA